MLGLTAWFLFFNSVPMDAESIQIAGKYIRVPIHQFKYVTILYVPLLTLLNRDVILFGARKGILDLFLN